MSACPAQMASELVPGHTHTCTGNHPDLTYHYCRECGRLWYKAAAA
jgi:hypothetical protein